MTRRFVGTVWVHKLPNERLIVKINARSFEPILQPNARGEVVAEPGWGGMRRVDRLMYERGLKTRPIGAAFPSALAGQTDHVPFCLTLEAVAE